MTENEKYVYEAFVNSIKSGLNSLESVIDEALGIVEDEGWKNEIPEEWVRDHTAREYERQVTAGKTWQYPTDCDRLVSAFDQICKAKIVALHCAGYTQEDALYDIKDVWEDLEDMDVHPVGYCFYTQQDMERAINHNVLALGFYGRKEKNDKEAIIVGNTIVNILRQNGFTVNWNNTPSKRIEIHDFKWHNIYTSDEDADEKWGYDRAIKQMSE